MKRFVFKREKVVPDARIDDCRELRKFIRNNLNVEISLRDTYDFWCKVSESWSAGWLYIDTHYEGYTREEFLLEMLERYGVLIDED